MLTQLLQIASGYHQQGNLQQAEQLYRQVLQGDPQQVAALHQLGVIAYQMGKTDRAIDYFSQLLRLQPDHVETHNNLGVMLQEQGRRDEAIASYCQALRLKSDFADAHNNLGVALLEQGNTSAAVASCRQALCLKPDYAEAHNNLGNALRLLGRLDEAIASWRQALRYNPTNALAYNNLGNALLEQGKLEEALANYRLALRLKPNYADAHKNMGQCLNHLGRLDEAVASYRQALRLNPSSAEAFNDLGNTLKEQGQLDEALAHYRHAIQLKPDFAAAHSNLVYTLNFCPEYDAATIFEVHQRWNRLHTEPLAQFIQPHANDRSPDRRLRIGYLSPDFRGHPVGRFLLPLLEAHDHANFEIFCYASLNVPDKITDRCRAQADVWRDVFGLSDEQIAQAIHQDRIDILVDLTMHLANNRLLVFARQPAPVQVSYLAYCGTTGLRTMDYRLTDPYLDPPGQDERYYSEQSIHLPETYWCFRPMTEIPPINSLPALQTRQVTFGCLNNFCKITTPTLMAWSRLLQALPQARLLLHARPGSHRDRVREFFVKQSVAPARISFVDRVPMSEYYQLYAHLDVALDPFPYNGGTTTCEALWMGVPVISLAGPTAVGRSGLSILSNVGLAELVAYDAEQYVNIAVELANDLPRLSKLRATLREWMQNSPLMDAQRFTRNMEAAYRDMWQRWCAE